MCVEISSIEYVSAYTDLYFYVIYIYRQRDYILANINMSYYVMHRRIERVGTVLTDPSARALRWPAMRDSQNKKV